MLAQYHRVYLWDINTEKINKIITGKVPFNDIELQKKFDEDFDKLSFVFEESFYDACKCSDIIIVAVPPNFDDAKGGFDTS